MIEWLVEDLKYQGLVPKIPISPFTYCKRKMDIVQKKNFTVFNINIDI